VLLDVKVGPVEIGLAMLEDHSKGHPVGLLKVRDGKYGGNIFLEAPIVAAIGIGISRFVSLADYDWDQCSEAPEKRFTVDGATAHVGVTRDPLENARRIVAAWNDAAGYGPGEGARADGAAVIWPETTRHPAQMKAEVAVHGPDDDEPSVGDVDDAVAMAQEPPC